jgi:sterol-4alpha-carboxylate 3-dehydrogenase (decarboxylating)
MPVATALRLCAWVSAYVGLLTLLHYCGDASHLGDEAISYMLVGATLVYMLRPHPAATGRVVLNEKRLLDSDSSKVDFRGVVLEQAPKTGKRYAVVGCGFLGKRIVQALLLRGETRVTVMDADPRACDVFKHDVRVTFVPGDVTKYEQVLEAIQGAENVFCTFAVIRFMDRLPHQAALSYRVNVNGTENVVRACREANVQCLVQTSTSNVCVEPTVCSVNMQGEKLPYVTRDSAPNHYGWTKAISEQLVLAADGNQMRTVSVRPCSAIFGSDDRYMLEPMLKLGRTILPPNGGSAVIDFVCVQNVVYGHLLAEKGLMHSPFEVGGQAFCVSNEAPIRMKDLAAITSRLRPGGLLVVPTPDVLIRVLAHVVEWNKWLGLLPTPRALDQLTSCTVEYLDLSYAFSSAKARQVLGYEPLYTVEQGVDMALKELAAGHMLPKVQQ